MRENSRSSSHAASYGLGLVTEHDALLREGDLHRDEHVVEEDSGGKLAEIRAANGVEAAAHADHGADARFEAADETLVAPVGARAGIAFEHEAARNAAHRRVREQAKHGSERARMERLAHVRHHEHLAVCRETQAIHRRRLAEARGVREHADARIALGELARDAFGVVRRAVGIDQYFELFARVVERREARDLLREVAGSVVDGEADADHRLEVVALRDRTRRNFRPQCRDERVAGVRVDERRERDERDARHPVRSDADAS